MFASPLYNGNISHCTIQHQSEQSAYTYSYDGLNRLTASNVVLSDEPKPSEVFTYDDKGNILTLQRYCYADTYNNGVLVDDLSFTYSGNQVTDICDYADPMDYYDLHDYENKSYIDEERPLFCYDANGNLFRSSTWKCKIRVYFCCKRRKDIGKATLWMIRGWN